MDESIRYDVVLFLNVLHHLISPVEAMKNLAQVANELLIVEFPTLLDIQTSMNLISRTIYKIFLSKSPLVYIDSRQYHRVWYFSKKAFVNLFVEQMKLFKKVEFQPSPRKKGRLIAYCWV